ncbi:MAG: hypothetical protein J2P17_06175 [Mycobacterium sp.]|nr:hypothetical protein [Mycobacterium sp.]
MTVNELIEMLIWLPDDMPIALKINEDGFAELSIASLEMYRPDDIGEKPEAVLWLNRNE